MTSHAFLVLLVVSLASALNVFNSNDTLPVQAEQLEMIVTVSGMILKTFVEPLTVQVGLDGNSVTLNTVRIQGSFRPVDTSTANAINRTNIAFVPCDPNTDTSFISPEDMVNTIASKEPRAIVLYSLASAHCGISEYGPYSTYFTVSNITQDTIRMFLRMSMENATIQSTTVSQQDPNNGSANGSSSQTIRNPAPAVAMSVLYAVTGIVTVLFLAIIATGAWRAHHNPERYGPRTGFAGHPRQSRARGLARAMLETLPIVKFGDPVPPKSPSRDIELEATDTNEPRTSNAHVTTDSQQRHEAQSEATSSEADDTNSLSQPNVTGSTPQPIAEGNPGCSICTEDFTKGEDVRVLPCNHQYHPACIDPWLLNISGTCPLCRVDLRPVRTNSHASSPSDANETSPPAVPDEGDHAHRSRVQRILAMRHAPVNERMATLRQLAREAGQQQQDSSTVLGGTAVEASHRSRLADRLREAFSIRTRNNVAPEEVSVAAAANSSPGANTGSETITRP